MRVKTILAVLFFLAAPVIVFADTESSPFPYTVETADKKHIFVSVKPDCERCWGSDKYRQSGMYLNDGSTTPLWTVEWNNYIFLPNGGKYVVRKAKWADYTATYREAVFSFVAEGRILKTYETRDLSDFPYLLPHTSSHYKVLNSSFNSDLSDGAVMKLDHGDGYPANQGAKIDAENRTFQIGTLHGDTYLFDLETGNIISTEHPARKTTFWLCGAVAVGFAAFLFLARNLRLNGFALKIANYAAGFFLVSGLFLIPVVTVWIHQTVPADASRFFPGFGDLCWMSVSMFPRYLLTSLNLISPPENYALSVNYEVTFMWLLVFWLPCAWLAGWLTGFINPKSKI